MRYDIFLRERENAAVTSNGLKLWWEVDDNGTVRGMLFQPKATNPDGPYRFRSIEQFEKWATERIAALDAHVARKLAYFAEKKAAVAGADMSLVEPGAVFRYSWGWEQTNIEYFQVVARSGQMVTLRAIGMESVPGSGYSHGMAEEVRPAVDGFLTQCGICRLRESAACHDEHLCNVGAWGNTPADYHAYEPAFKEIRKRVRFSGGSPYFTMDHGNLSAVKVVRFGNAAPLVAGSDYRSWYA
jgi:hypothetical protein